MKGLDKDFILVHAYQHDHVLNAHRLEQLVPNHRFAEYVSVKLTLLGLFATSVLQIVFIWLLVILKDVFHVFVRVSHKDVLHLHILALLSKLIILVVPEISYKLLPAIHIIRLCSFFFAQLLFQRYSYL